METKDQPLDPLKILDIESKTIAGKYVLEGEPYDKWKIFQEPRDKLLNEPTEVTKLYGNIRTDSMNKPRFHGQFDSSNTLPSVDIHQMEREFTEKLTSAQEEQSDSLIEGSENFSPSTEKKRAEPAPEFDQRFPLSTKSSPQPSRIGEFNFKHSAFWSEIRNTTEKTVTASTIHFLARYRDMVEEKKTLDEKDVNFSLLEGAKVAKNEPLESSQDVLEDLARPQIADGEKLKAVSTETAPQDDESSVSDSEELARIITAQEYLSKLKEGKVKPRSPVAQRLISRISEPSVALDSQGFNSFIGYAPILRDFRKVEIIKYLAENILFCDNGILIINKPFGLISQGKKKDKSNDFTHNLPDLLPDFTEYLLKNGRLTNTNAELSICHRLDKDATGVLVLATDRVSANRVSELFAQRKVRKEYLTITRGIPDPPSAIIDIPIEEGSINGKERMVLRPTLREELRRIASPSKMAKRAVTNYSVIDSHGSAALLKITTETGVKHQIRVHLGFGLRCPILGDHKYAHLNSLSPQKLPGDMLMSLNVRQSKVRNIPLHLHSQVIFLPEIGRNQSPIIARAPLPEFFKKTMKMLKLVKR